MAIGDASRASMNFATVRVGERGKSVSAQRRNITAEAQRKSAGADAVAHYAAQNPAINTAMTRFNIDCVNDGTGGFRPTESVDEVVAYGDARLARLPKPPKGGNRVAVTAVGHLPWGLCEPDGTYYQPLDKNGQPRVYADGPSKGKPHLEPRYRIAAGKEADAMRYFECWLEYQARLLPDGQKGMHGYSINLDESRPHIQLLSDPFEPDPTAKQPDRLRNGFSRAFGSHRADRLVPARNRDGTPALLPDGSAKMVREGASRKMERYHDEHRQFLLERGFDIEAGRDEARHDRHLELADYKDLQHQRTEVDEVAAGLAVDRRRLVEDENIGLATVAEAEQVAFVEAAEIDLELTARSAALDQREAEIEEQRRTTAGDRAVASFLLAEAETANDAWERDLPQRKQRVADEVRAEIEPELRRALATATANAAAADAALREAERLLQDAAHREADSEELYARVTAIPPFDRVAFEDSMKARVYLSIKNLRTVYDGHEMGVLDVIELDQRRHRLAGVGDRETWAAYRRRVGAGGSGGQEEDEPTTSADGHPKGCSCKVCSPFS